MITQFLRRLERALYRRLRNKYEAAQQTRITPQRRDRASADSALWPAGEQMRENARGLEQNSDLADGALNTLCAKVIGTGLVPEPMVRLNNGDPAVQFNNDLADLWQEWSERPDVTRSMSTFQAQDLAARAWFRDGEVFDHVLAGDVRGLTHGGAVPLSFELLEADLFPFDLNDNGRRIVHAVEKNGWGRPIAYHKYRDHPGDIATGLVFSSDIRQAVGGLLGTRRIPATRILHTRLVKRPGQTRGATVFHSTMNRFRDVKDYDESERVAAQVAAAACAVLKQQAPPEFDPADGSDKPNFAMEPGTIFRLALGEDASMLQANRPNPELTNFRNSQLRSAAAGLGVAFSTIARLYDTSYTAMRQEQVDTEANYRRMTHQFVHMRERPLWRRFVEAALVSGRIRIPRGVDRNTLFRVMVIPPASPWIDPKKEIEADILALTGGESGMPLMSWSQVLRKRGLNPQDTLEQIAEQRELFDRFRPDTEVGDGQSDETNPNSSEEQAA